MKGLLLDTHALLWWADKPARLSAEAREHIEAAEREIFVSVATAWEIGIKKASGKLEAPSDIAGLLRANGFGVISITLAHVERAAELPLHHRDPFDRLLVAQAQLEKLTLVSADQALARYGIDLLAA